jgi:hypothetical protein
MKLLNEKIPSFTSKVLETFTYESEEGKSRRCILMEKAGTQSFYDFIFFESKF